MDFKRLSDVEVVAEPTESANVLIEEDGVIKKAPKTAVGGGAGNFVVINIPYEQEMDVGVSSIIEGATCNKTYDEVIEMYCANEIDCAVIKTISEREGYSINVCNYIFLCNADGNVSISDAVLAECIGFNFPNQYGSIGHIYYYRNGLAYVSPYPQPQ